MIRSVDRLTALPAATWAFVFGHVLIEAGERVERAAANRAIELGLFVVFLVGHSGNLKRPEAHPVNLFRREVLQAGAVLEDGR